MNLKKLYEEQKYLIEKKDEEVLFLKNIIENLPGSIYCKDKNGIYLYRNNSSARSMKDFNFSWKWDEIVGKTDYDLFPRHMADKFRKNDLHVMETKEELVTEEIAMLPSGEEAIQLSTKKPLIDKNGDVIGVMGNTVDITYLKKIEKELRKANEKSEMANKTKTEFLENMRHDIRTPLTGIIGCAEIIKKSKDDSCKVGAYSDILIKSSNALLNFLNDILESVQATSGEIPLLQRKFNLESVLSEAIKFNQAKACEKQLGLKLECDPLIPKYLIGDSKRLYRIVLELVTNALKYTNQGNITVSAKLVKNDKGNVVIKVSVEDTGIGIPLNQQQEIFTRFKRLNPSSEGVYNGSGLGLTIAKQFINDLNAEIYVMSEINKGSVFTCVIPFKEVLLTEDFGTDLNMETYSNSIELPKISDSLSNFQSNSSYFIHILLVEDHDITAKITQEILSDSNCQVDVASNGEMAITLIEKNDYDIVFMDIGLPDINGYEVTQKIRSGIKNKSVPIIGLTAHISTEEKQHCLDVGMNTVFIKPLMREKIQNIFDIFIPVCGTLETDKSFVKKSNDDEALLVLTSEVVDLELGLKLTNGNEALASGLLSALVKSFPEELEKLDVAYQSRNWEIVESILHKLRGGLRYCVVPRLREACIRFDDYLKSGKKALIEALYQQFLSEFDKVKEKVGKLGIS